MCTQRMMVIKIMIMTQPNIRFLIENALIMRKITAKIILRTQVYEDSMNFSSMADYEDFLIWGTDNKDQFI